MVPCFAQIANLFMPEKIREALEQEKVINIGKARACQYDCNHDILYITKEANFYYRDMYSEVFREYIENFDVLKLSDGIVCSYHIIKVSPNKKIRWYVE